MRIQPPLELSGYFWLPEDSKGRLPGTLRVSDSGACTLEVLGIFGCDPVDGHPFAAFAQPKNFNRIVGLVEGGAVTLEHCAYRTSKASFGGVSKSTFYVGTALLGCCYDPGEDICVSSLDITVEGLDDWLHTSGLRVEFDWHAKNASIHYSPPKETRLCIDGMEVSFGFAWEMPAKPFMTEAKISQTAVLSASTEAQWKLKDAFAVAHRLTNFLCFAAGKTVAIKSMTVYSNDVVMEIDEGQQRRVPLKVYYASLPKSNGEQVEPDEMLFRFPEVQDFLESAVKAWMGEYGRLSPAINLFLSAQSDSHAFAESRFLAVAQAAETLHRRTSSESVMPNDTFDELVGRVMAGCPDEHPEWLGGRLAYANEPSLRVRLKRLMKPFRHLFGNDAARSSSQLPYAL